jgi:hypothetical protein
MVGSSDQWFFSKVIIACSVVFFGEGKTTTYNPNTKMFRKYINLLIFTLYHWILSGF